MNSIDLAPLYRSSIGFDHLENMLNNAYDAESAGLGYPPYNIEVLDEKSYAITLAVAGFENSELDIQIEKGVLTVSGNKGQDDNKEYLHHGIANRAFKRQFNLADYVEVRGADLRNGLLTINLVKEIPEAMKPRTIAIDGSDRSIENKTETASVGSEAA